MGRKAIKIDLKVLAGLAGQRLSQTDIAAIMGFSKRTLEKGLAEDDAVREAYEKGKADAKSKVSGEVMRRAMGKNGSDALLLHLHKTMCGQTEKIQVEHTGAKKEAPGMSFENKRRSMAELLGEDPNDEASGTEDDVDSSLKVG